MDLLSKRIADEEFEEIMKDFDDMKYDFDYVNRLYSYIKEILSISTEPTDELRKLFYSIGRCMFGMRFEYSREDVRRKVSFLGSHDYNVTLSRNFDEAISFYIEWFKSIEVFVTSRGTVYPRYSLEIMTGSGKKGRGFTVAKTVLLTKDDFPNTEVFQNCNLPFYYAIPDENVKYGTLDDQMKLFKKCMGRMWKDAFKRYKNEEYPIFNELETNTDKYKNLSDTVILK